jgi:hypothetical protein
MLAYDYPLFAVFWSLAFLAVAIIFLYLLLWVFVDIFRSQDISGAAKALWLVFVIFAPLVGILAYVIVRVRDRELVLTERMHHESRERHQDWQKAESRY